MRRTLQTLLLEAVSQFERPNAPSRDKQDSALGKGMMRTLRQKHIMRDSFSSGDDGYIVFRRGESFRPKIITVDDEYQGIGWQVKGHDRIMNTFTLCAHLSGKDRACANAEIIEELCANTLTSEEFLAELIANYLTNDGTSLTLPYGYQLCAQWEDMWKRTIDELSIYGTVPYELQCKIRRLHTTNAQLMAMARIMEFFSSRLTATMRIIGASDRPLKPVDSIRRTKQLASWFQLQGIACTFPIRKIKARPSLDLGTLSLECPQQVNSIHNAFWCITSKGESHVADTPDTALNLTWQLLEGEFQDLLVHPHTAHTAVQT